MRRTRRSFELPVCLGLAAALLLGGCGHRAAEKHERQLFAMDTVMLLTAYGDDGDAALDAAVGTINALAADLDPEKEGSSVYALNAAPAGTAVTVSRDCCDILSTAANIHKATDGALDVGLYPIIKAWGFTTGEYRVPEAAELDRLLTEKNTPSIVVDGSGPAVTLPEGTEISLGAVAKGYAAQKAVEAMAAAGAEHAILSLGGNVQTLGDTRPDGKPWQVAVTDPNDTGSYVGTVSVGQTAVVTSGGYQRYFEQDGKKYIHILDPATGYPVDNGLASVTVVTADGATADGLSTALFVLGEEKALDFYDRAYDSVGGFELVLITDDGRVVVTPGLAEGFTENSDDYTYEYIG